MPPTFLEKIGHFATRDLASALANLILLSGPFFTLIWGWNNSEVIIAAAIENWLAASAIPLIADPLYSPDFTPVDFFLFTKAKQQLAGLSLTQKSLKKTWGGVSKTITAEDVAAAFCHWFEWSKKCVRMGGDHVEKS